MGRIRIKLRQAMDSYESRTGLRVTYSELAERTGLSLPTLQSIGSRETYNATLDVVAKICTALAITPNELLDWSEEE